MIVCKVCGTQNEVGAGFCGSCGSFLEWNGEAFNADGTPGAPEALPAVPPVEPAATPPAAPTPAPPSARPSIPPNEPAADGAVICPACGASNEPTRIFCRRCATELAPPAAVARPAVAEPPHRRSGPPLAVLGGVAAVVVLAVIAAIVVLPKGAPTPVAGSGTIAPSTASPSASATATASAGAPTDSPPGAAPTPAAPTGEIVFAVNKGGNLDLWTWDAATGKVHVLLAAPGIQSDPSWSPDRSKVVYRGATGLGIITADGKPGSPPDFTHHAQDINPAWSPDGRTIVFATNRSPLTSLDVYARPADDNQAVITPLVSSKADDWDPAWSPDSSRIVFASRRLGDAHLFLMNADGSDQTEVPLGPGVYDDPTISPDGQWLAFTRRDNANALKALYIAHLDGSGMRRMTNSTVDENDMTWSPDGRYIAVVRGDAGSRIVVLDVATGVEVTSFGVDGARSLVPDWR